MNAPSALTEMGVVFLQFNLQSYFFLEEINILKTVFNFCVKSEHFDL